MSDLIHVNIDGILKGWKSEAGTKESDGVYECSVGRVCRWGAHYIAIIHDDVPEDEREELARFIAAAPKKISDLEAELATANKKCNTEQINTAYAKTIETQELTISAMHTSLATARDEIVRLKAEINEFMESEL